MLRYRDIQCRSLFTLCRENVQTFTRKIAMVNDFAAALATVICTSISLPFVNLCGGKRLELRRKTETGDFQYPCHMFSEFIFCDDAKLNEIEEISGLRVIFAMQWKLANYSWSSTDR